jgi:hypothetical protein
MKKVLKVSYGFLTAVLIIAMTSLPFAIFNLSKVLYLFTAGILCIIFSIALRKSRILSISNLLSCVFILSAIVIIVKIQNINKTEKVIWNSPNESFTVNFIVGKQGDIYLDAKINDTTGLFLFDTGYDLSAVNEKFVTDENMKLHPYTTSDVNGIKQTKNVFKVKWFVLGAIEIKRLHVYPADSITWTSPKGIYYKKDSILGIIGNNIISKFIWDFDLINKRVTVSNKKTYCNTIPGSMAINLVSKDNHKEIAVRINEEKKMLTLDFGSVFPIVISDSIPNQKVFGKKDFYSQEISGALNHLDSTDGRDRNIDFVDIKLGAYEFKQIECFEKAKTDLLGLPFIWAFKRVVIDFMNSKVYFISENDSASDLGVNKYNRQSMINRISIIKSKPDGMPFIIERGSTRMRYVLYGSSKLYKNNNRLDSVICFDSLLLPNGKKKYGPFTIRFKE